MRIDWLKRIKNKPFYLFLAALIYKILQDSGVIVSPQSWEYYINAGLYILMALGIIVDTSTPGFSDKNE